MVVCCHLGIVSWTTSDSLVECCDHIESDNYQYSGNFVSNHWSLWEVFKYPLKHCIIIENQNLTFVAVSKFSDARRRTPTHADARRRTPTHADARRRTPTHADARERTPNHANTRED